MKHQSKNTYCPVLPNYKGLARFKTRTIMKFKCLDVLSDEDIKIMESFIYDTIYSTMEHVYQTTCEEFIDLQLAKLKPNGVKTQQFEEGQKLRELYRRVIKRRGAKDNHNR